MKDLFQLTEDGRNNRKCSLFFFNSRSFRSVASAGTMTGNFFDEIGWQ
jgi:hypothetical protein